MFAKLQGLIGLSLESEKDQAEKDQTGPFDPNEPIAFSQSWNRFEAWLGSWLPWVAVLLAGLWIGGVSALGGTGLNWNQFSAQALSGPLAYRFQLVFTLWLTTLIGCVLAYIALVLIPLVLKRLELIWLVIAVVGGFAGFAAFSAWQSEGTTSGLGWFSDYLPWACGYALWLVFFLPVVRQRTIVILAIACTFMSLAIAFQNFDWGPLIRPVPLLEPNSSALPLTTA